MSDIRQLLLAAFEVEHREHIEAIRAALGAAGEDRLPDWNDVFRRAHSLKGAARAVDLPAVEALAHRLEALFERVRTGTPLNREAANATQLALDRIEAYVAALGQAPGAALPAMPGDALRALEACLAGPTEAAAPASAAKPAPGPAAPPPTVPSPPAPAEPAAEFTQAMLRVPAEAVEAMARASHDLASTLGAGVGLNEGLTHLARQAGELSRWAARLGAEASPGREPLRAVETALAGLAREASDLVRRHAAATNALESAVSRVRAEAERLALVPAETVLGPLARSLRETAREQGREVDVAMRGLDVPVDRATLQVLKDPVLHALRNALSHGYEEPTLREAAGKPAALAVALEVAVRGGRLVVAVSDDGPGPDLAAIEARARERGLLAPDERAGPEALLALVFEPGFSTAARVDTLSGRGFGLSVAADAARALQGSVRLEVREPHGSRLAMSLPLAAARRSLLLVKAGGGTFALPGAAVERLLRVERASLSRALGRTLLRLPLPGGAEASLPVVALADILGLPGAPAEPRVTAILLRAGASRLVLAVEALQDVNTLLVLPMPAFGADPDLVAGTALLQGDRPVLVLDPEGLLARAEGMGAAGADAAEPPGGTMADARRSTFRATILVVDDSITTRTLEKGILEAAGYRVVVCVDGQDALDRLRAEIERVDLVLADVEMPRLDGFGLLEALRADARFQRLPVVLMTSRGAAEDVARGLELGADAYLTKQSFDQRALLDTIGRLL